MNTEADSSIVSKIGKDIETTKNLFESIKDKDYCYYQNIKKSIDLLESEERIFKHWYEATPNGKLPLGKYYYFMLKYVFGNIAIGLWTITADAYNPFDYSENGLSGIPMGHDAVNFFSKLYTEPMENSFAAMTLEEAYSEITLYSQWMKSRADLSREKEKEERIMNDIDFIERFSKNKNVADTIDKIAETYQKEKNNKYKNH